MAQLEDLKPRITIHIGTTINMGSYESVRVDVGLELDVPAGMTVSEARKWVQDRLLIELDATAAEAVDHLYEEDKKKK